MEDQNIVVLYWQRDPSAIEASKEKYGAYCYTVARHIVAGPEDAEECVNDTWLHAWNTMPPHRPALLRPFLAKLTRRLALDRFRRDRAQKRGGGQAEAALEELTECLSPEDSPETQVIAGELAQSVNRFLSALPERECSIFLRRYFYAEAPREIAARYGLSPNHVSVLLGRTRKKLKQQLTKEGYFHESK